MATLTRLLSLTLLGAALTVAGGSLQPVWTWDLHKTSGARPDVALPVRAVRFSPDGKRIAVLAGFSRDSDGRRTSGLFIAGIQGPSVDSSQITIATGVDELEGELAPQNNFQWSPRGSSLFVGGAWVTLSSNEVCNLPAFGGFVADDRVIADATGDFSRLLEFGLGCQSLSTWSPGQKWRIVDTQPEKHLLLVSREIKGRFPTESETLVVNAESRNVLLRWPSADVPAGHFADSGRAICDGGDADEADRVPVRCWDSVSGKVIATAPTVNGGSPFAVASAVTRMIASDYHRYQLPFTSEYREHLKQRVVWDFGTGQELASWSPERQDYVDQSTQTPMKVSDMAKFAISPDGNYVVDGANGVIRLYKIVP